MTVFVFKCQMATISSQNIELPVGCYVKHHSHGNLEPGHCVKIDTYMSRETIGKISERSRKMLLMYVIYTDGCNATAAGH